MRYGDLHSDTLTAARGAEQFLHMKNAQISLEKLIGGDCVLQCFALFSRSASSDPWGRALPFLSAFRAAEGELKSAGIRGVLTIEDGGLLENDLSRLETLLAAGVKMFGFTWNDENCLGFPCGMRGGLKPFGLPRGGGAVFPRDLRRRVPPFRRRIFRAGGHGEKLRRAARRQPLARARHLPPQAQFNRRPDKDLARLGGVVGVNFVRRFAGCGGACGARKTHRRGRRRGRRCDRDGFRRKRGPAGMRARTRCRAFSRTWKGGAFPPPARKACTYKRIENISAAARIA